MKNKHMKHLIFALCLICLSFSVAHGINARLPFNGESWNKLKELAPSEESLAKKMLIRGCYEGAFATKPEKAVKLYSTDRSLEDLVSAVDDFYSEPKNLNIPVGVALRVISMELKGVPKAERDAYLEHLRTFVDRIFAQISKEEESR